MSLSRFVDIQSPGLMKSERPKSVAFNGESSFGDLKRKFYKKEMCVRKAT